MTQTKPGIATEIATQLPSGQAIPISNLRQVLNDMNTAIFQAQGDSGLVISGTPTAGQVPVATSTTTASWQDQSGGGGGALDDGSIIVTAFNIVLDGVTNNLTAWQAFKRTLKTLNRGQKHTFTITPGSPATFNITDHGFQEGQALVPTTTGSLPAGLNSGDVYYVLSKQNGTITKDTFQLSSTNPAGQFDGVSETPVNLASAGSGTHTFQESGSERLKIVFPPGHYSGTLNFSGIGGNSNLDVEFNGTVLDDFAPGDFTVYAYGQSLLSDPTHQWEYASYIQSYYASDGGGGSTITLQDISEAWKYPIGSWVLVNGVDTQSTLGGFGDGTPTSGPANNHNKEIARIASKSGANITFDRRLKQSYLSTWPIFYSGVNLTTPGLDRLCGGGAANILPLNPNWNSERVYRGGHVIGGGQQATSCRRIHFEDMKFDGTARGIYPSITEKVIHLRCYWGPNADIEVDKLNGFVGYYDCDIQCGVTHQSSSTDDIVYQGTYLKSLNGTDRSVTLDHSECTDLQVGPSGSGFTDALRITQSDIGKIQPSNYFWAPGSSVYGAKLSTGYIGSYTFSNGVLSQPLHTTNANQWAVPGGNMYLADYANRYDNMGTPFKVKDIYMSPAESTATSITLTAPGNLTPTDAVLTWAAVTNGDIIIFTGPKVGWPFTPNGTVSPWLIQPYFPFKVIQKGGFAGPNDFKIATLTAPTTPVQVTGNSASVQALLNPQLNIKTSLKSLPTGDSAVLSNVTITIANPAVFTKTGHGLNVDDVVMFSSTTGSLPGAGIDGGGVPHGVALAYPYYVSARIDADNFRLAASPSVFSPPDISTLTYSQSGTHTAVKNPIQFARHPCAKLTTKGNRGGAANSLWTSIGYLEGHDNEPMYSRGSAIYDHKVFQDNAVYIPNLYAWGYVETFEIEVIDPWAGTGTAVLTLSYNAFDTSASKHAETQVIDLAQAGLRVITNTGVTGNKGASGGNPGDTLHALDRWLSGKITPSVAYSAGGGADTVQPMVRFKIKTLQGITNVTDYISLTSSTGTEGHTSYISGTSVITKPQ